MEAFNLAFGFLIAMTYLIFNNRIWHDRQTDTAFYNMGWFKLSLFAIQFIIPIFVLKRLNIKQKFCIEGKSFA